MSFGMSNKIEKNTLLWRYIKNYSVKVIHCLRNWFKYVKSERTLADILDNQFLWRLYDLQWIKQSPSLIDTKWQKQELILFTWSGKIVSEAEPNLGNFLLLSHDPRSRLHVLNGKCWPLASIETKLTFWWLPRFKTIDHPRNINNKSTIKEQKCLPSNWKIRSFCGWLWSNKSKIIYSHYTPEWKGKYNYYLSLCSQMIFFIIHFWSVEFFVLWFHIQWLKFLVCGLKKAIF